MVSLFFGFIDAKVLYGSFDLSFVVRVLLWGRFWGFERASKEEWIPDLVYVYGRPWWGLGKHCNVLWGRDNEDHVLVSAFWVGFNWVCARRVVYQVGGRHGRWAGGVCWAACLESRRVV